MENGFMPDAVGIEELRLAIAKIITPFAGWDRPDSTWMRTSREEALAKSADILALQLPQTAERVKALEEENARLRAIDDTFARHNIFCGTVGSYGYGYCSCGLDAARAALAPASVVDDDGNK